MKNLRNLFDIWWHYWWSKSYERHYPFFTYIGKDKHWYCDCGYKKPQRIYVSIRD